VASYVGPAVNREPRVGYAVTIPEMNHHGVSTLTMRERWLARFRESRSGSRELERAEGTRSETDELLPSLRKEEREALASNLGARRRKGRKWKRPPKLKLKAGRRSVLASLTNQSRRTEACLKFRAVVIVVVVVVVVVVVGDNGIKRSFKEKRAPSSCRVKASDSLEIRPCALVSPKPIDRSIRCRRRRELAGCARISFLHLAR